MFQTKPVELVTIIHIQKSKIQIFSSKSVESYVNAFGEILCNVHDCFKTISFPEFFYLFDEAFSLKFYTVVTN